MKHLLISVSLLVFNFASTLPAQKADSYKPDFSNPAVVKGMSLVWNDEFNISGKPDTSVWRYEKGFVRNQELQWYQSENANCKNGLLIIEGRKENFKNPGYVPGSTNWKTNREYAEYSSSSIQTRGKKQFQFGRFEIRARIDTACGSWPAIWTLGITKTWPSNGEIDIMEFYRIKGVPTILANFAWGTNQRNVGKWDDLKKPLSDFIKNDPDWTRKFHVWRMDWTKDSISLFIDDQLLNSVLLGETYNPDGFNPFLQPHYILLNLALGGNGGDPSKSMFPIKYEVDYVRVYQEK
ncbi:MAG: glycoside hydrolase family 16 protein [Bacteroidales bacterium]|nr:glycoside hydrolase family 16 protein [Bacteroidales bacterium]